MYQIRPGVAKVRRQQSFLLVAPDSGSSVRVSPIAEELMPLLASGARFDQLAARLKTNHPTVKDVEPKLKGFLDQLLRSGLLSAQVQVSRRRHDAPKIVLFHPDPWAAHIARWVSVVPAWVRWSILVALLIGAVAGVLGLVWERSVPGLRDIILAMNPIAIGIFVLVVVPIHEAGHAVVCRFAGAKVGPAGIFLHGWLIPGPFVDTTGAYQIRERWKRFWIPAAGPIVDLLAAGAAAWVLLTYGGANETVKAVASSLFLLCAVFLFLDTNPLAPSDGSRMLEAAMDDELARRSALSPKRALLSHWRAVAWYRVACAIYVQATAVIAYFWIAG